MSLLVGSDALIPVSLLTGFLGSGKTTILNRLVRDPAMRKALVIINEFGSIGIDHDLIASSQEEIVVEMSSGCLCCTIRGDLVQALQDAPQRFARDGVCSFDRVLIETTGLADPLPILHTLMMDGRLASLYRLDSVITTVDAATGSSTLDTQQESVRQAAVADRLLLTKTDLVSFEETASIEARLTAINPAAPIVHAFGGDLDPAQLFGAWLYDPAAKSEEVRAWLSAEAYASYQEGDSHGHHHGAGHHHHDVNRHDDLIRAICLTFDEPLRTNIFERWLDLLMLCAGPDILRMKAIVNLTECDKPMVLHGVQHIFHPPVMLDAWPSQDRRTRIVFITRDIDEAVLRHTLTALTESLSRFEIYGAEGFGLVSSTS